MNKLADPFDLGYAAYLQGSDQFDNPYPHDSDEHLSWNDGYSHAEETDLE